MPFFPESIYAQVCANQLKIGDEILSQYKPGGKVHVRVLGIVEVEGWFLLKTEDWEGAYKGTDIFSILKKGS